MRRVAVKTRCVVFVVQVAGIRDLRAAVKRALPWEQIV